MKILHFTHSFFPDYGGTATRLYNLLSQSEHEHHLYIPLKESDSINEKPIKDDRHEMLGNIRVSRKPIAKKKKLKVPYLSTQIDIMRSASELANSVQGDGFNIVHAHNPLIFALAGMKYAKRKNLPLIYEIHTLLKYKSSKGKYIICRMFYSAIEQLLRWQEGRVCHSASRVIVQTEDLKKEIARIYDLPMTKIVVIPMGFDSDVFNPDQWSKQGEVLKLKYAWKNKIIFFYNGFLHSENGIDFFLKTVLRLRDSYKNKIKIIITGRGPLQKEIEKMAQETEHLIEFIGLVDHQQIASYYAACDIVVIPWKGLDRKQFNIPTKLLEAMSMSKIILASRLRGIMTILKENENGFLFEPDNENDLIEKIEKIVCEDEDLNEMRDRAKEAVIHEYPWNLFRMKLEKLYTEISRH